MATTTSNRPFFGSGFGSNRIPSDAQPVSSGSTTGYTSASQQQSVVTNAPINSTNTYRNPSIGSGGSSSGGGSSSHSHNVPSDAKVITDSSGKVVGYESASQQQSVATKPNAQEVLNKVSTPKQTAADARRGIVSRIVERLKSPITPVKSALTQPISETYSEVKTGVTIVKSKLTQPISKSYTELNQVLREAQPARKTPEQFEASKGKYGNTPVIKALSKVEADYTKLYNEDPLKFLGTKVAVPLAIGVATGGAGTVISSIGPKAATVVQLTGLGLGGVYGVTKVKQIIAAPTAKDKYVIVFETGGELLLFGVGAKVGSKAALSAGFKPQPSYIPKLKLSDYKVQVGEGDSAKIVNLGRNLEVVIPATGKGTNIVGYRTDVIPSVTKMVGGKEIAVPEFKYKLLDFNVPQQKRGIVFGNKISGFKPQFAGDEFATISMSTPTQAKITSSILKDTGRPGEFQKFSDIRSIGDLTFKTKSKVYTTEIEKPASYKYKEASDYTISSLNKEKTWLGKRATEIFGSASSRTQVRPEFSSLIGETGDFDALLAKSSTASGKIATSQAKALRGNFGESAFVTAEEPLLVQTKYGGKGHKVDIHTIWGDASSSQAAPESFFGKPFGQKSVKIGDIQGMPLSEAGIRAASSITTLRGKAGETFIAPEAHRVKDIGRFFAFQNELTAISGKGSKELSTLESLYPKEVIYSNVIAPKETYSPSFKGRTPGITPVNILPKSEKALSNKIAATVSPAKVGVFSPSIAPKIPSAPTSFIMSPYISSPYTPTKRSSPSIPSPPSPIPTPSVPSPTPPPPSPTPSLFSPPSSPIPSSPTPSNYYYEEPAPPMKPIGGWPGMDLFLGEKGFKKGKGSNKKTAYQPSFDAMIRGIFSPKAPPKGTVFTGQETRAIIGKSRFLFGQPPKLRV